MYNTEIAEIAEKTMNGLVFSEVSAISALIVRLCVLGNEPLSMTRENVQCQ